MSLSSLPPGVLVVLGILAVLELILDVIALLDLYRRPIERVTLGNKWVWVAVIVLVNTIGPILYLAIGRRPEPATDQPPTAAAPQLRGDDIADSLYGPRDHADPR